MQRWMLAWWACYVMPNIFTAGQWVQHWLISDREVLRNHWITHLQNKGWHKWWVHNLLKMWFRISILELIAKLKALPFLCQSVLTRSNILSSRSTVKISTVWTDLYITECKSDILKIDVFFFLLYITTESPKNWTSGSTGSADQQFLAAQLVHAPLLCLHQNGRNAPFSCF